MRQAGAGLKRVYGQPGYRFQTIVELAVADVIGRLRSGQKIQPGVVSDALTAVVSDNWTLRFFRSIKHYLKGIFGVMSEFNRARAEGRLKEGDEWTAFVDQLVGVDGQKAHEAAVINEVGAGIITSSLSKPLFGSMNVKGLRVMKTAWSEAGFDVAEAERIVDVFYKKAAFAGIPKDALLVAMPSTSGRNLIPSFLAARIAQDFGQEIFVGNVGSATAKEEAKKKVGFWAKVEDPVGFDPGQDLERLKSLGKPVVIVEDVHNTGESWVAFADFLFRHGIEVVDVAALTATDSRLTSPRDMERLAQKVAGLTGKPLEEVLPAVQSYFDGTFKQFFNKAEAGISSAQSAARLLAFVTRSAREGGTPGETQRRNAAGLRGPRSSKGAEGDLLDFGGQGENFSLSSITAEEDSRHAYLEQQAKAGDARAIEEAQAMVTAAAKAAGYNVGPVWHGTNSDFTAFIPGEGMYGRGIYLADDYEYAKGFADGPTGKVLSLYAKINDGINGVILPNKRGGIYLAESPNQIKSADPFTYDENGELIPLSERFNPQRNEMTFSLSPILKKRTDVPKSWDEVRPGHLWSSAKKHLPKTGEKRPLFGIKNGSWETIVKRLASWLGVMVNPVDPWGAEVVLANPENGSLETRAEHLTGKSESNGRIRDDSKVGWLGAIVPTIENAQVRVMDGAETLYFRSYKEGIHMVVVANGKVEDQYALVTQYAPESRKQFEGAVVERIRPDTRLAARGRPDSTGLRVQSSSSDAVDSSELKARESGSASGSGQSKISPSGSNSGGGRNFSLSSVNNLEDIAERIESMQGGSKAKLEIYADMARSISGMARAARHNEELDAVLRVGEIERERRVMQADLAEKYIEEVWRGPAGPAMSDEESTKLKNEPIVQALLDAGGLMSRGAALRSGLRLGAEYEGSELLPPMLFGGRLTPDQMADVLANTKGEEGDESFLADAYPDTLWDALHQAVASVRKRRDLLQSGKEQIAEAKVRAREEARQWAAVLHAFATNAISLTEQRNHEVVPAGFRCALSGPLRSADGVFAVYSRDPPRPL